MNRMWRRWAKRIGIKITYRAEGAPEGIPADWYARHKPVSYTRNGITVVVPAA